MKACLIEINNINEPIKISPIGIFTGKDGRVYSLEPNIVLANTKKEYQKLLVDLEHGESIEKDRAVAWIDVNSLVVKDDGIYANLDFTRFGKLQIESNEYKYLSPTYKRDKFENNTRVIHSIIGAGLVNRPNLLDEELNEQGEYIMNEEQLKLLQNENKTLKDEIEALKSQLQAIREANFKMNIDLAVEQNKILPSQIEFCKTLNENQLTKFIESNSVSFEHLKQKIEPNSNSKQNEKSELAKEIDKALGLGE